MRNKKVPCSRIGKTQNQVLFPEFIQCYHTFPGQGIFIGYGKDQGICIQHYGIEIGIGNTALHNGQIYLIGFELHIKIIYGVRNNCYACFLTHTAVSGKDLHHDIALRGMRDPHRYLSGMFFFFLQALLQVLIQAVNPFGILDDNLSLPGKLEISFSPGKNRNPELLFQLPYMLAYGRLGKRQLFGRLGKAVQFVHHKQGDEFAVDHGNPSL